MSRCWWFSAEPECPVCAGFGNLPYIHICALESPVLSAEEFGLTRGPKSETMSDVGEVQPSIRSFILEKFPAAKRRVLQDDAPLLESGIIDSLGILDVVEFVERMFLIKIEDEELTPDNFGSIQRLASFVEQKRSRVDIPAIRT